MASASRLKSGFGSEINQHDLTRVFEYQNYRRQHVDRVLNAQAHESIKSSHSLVAPRNSAPEMDTIKTEGECAKKKRRTSKSRDPTEPILQSLHILQRGGLTGHKRSGFCQGGLTSDEVVRKLEHQKDNFDLMCKLHAVQTRKNEYLDNAPFAMMSKQTRSSRQKRELEKANLGLYLQIVHSKPQVSKVQQLRIKEQNRTRLKNVLSRRVANADRVKSIANSLLREKYGTTGSSNRLFSQCKTCKCEKALLLSQTPQHKLNSLDLGLHEMSLISPEFSHSITVDVDRSAQQLASVRNLQTSQNTKAARKRPTSAVVRPGRANAYLESQFTNSARKHVPSTASRTNTGHQFYSSKQIEPVQQSNFNQSGSAVIPAFLTSLRQHRMLQSREVSRTAHVDSLLSENIDKQKAGQEQTTSWEIHDVQVGSEQIVDSQNPTLELLDRPRHEASTNIVTRPEFPPAISTQVPSTTGSGENLHRMQLEEIQKMRHPSIKTQKQKAKFRKPKPQSAKQRLPASIPVYHSLAENSNARPSDGGIGSSYKKILQTSAGQTQGDFKKRQASRSGGPDNLSRGSTSKTRSTTAITHSKSSWTLQSKICGQSKRDKKQKKLGRSTQASSIGMRQSTGSQNQQKKRDQFVVVGSTTDGLQMSNRPSTSIQANPHQKTSQMSLRNNFEHERSRKTILKNALVEIEKEVGSI